MLRLVPRDARPFDATAREALRPYAGVTASLLYSRGVDTAARADAFLHPSLGQLHDPMLLSGMGEALALVRTARDERWPVVVYGDYDVDGICACALLTLALREYGVDATPHVPLRAEGYGLNAEAVRGLAGRYRLLVTVDLGITNHEEVRLAQSLGMRVVVTDHHALALTDSPADAAVNPLLGDYPFRRLCGTGVAFKLAQALLGLENCEKYLDLAAIATVADIVPLTDENRVLTALGLKRVAARERAGVRALLAVSGDPAEVDAETLGFRLGPRLNAAGRLGDAMTGVKLMLTDDEDEATRLARELDELNTRRKAAEADLVREAEARALTHDFIAKPLLMVRGEGWNLGVIGLAAGRLCQRYFCPTCVLSEEDGMLHGSLRSVPGVHIQRCLQACDELLERYGGHEQAAGVTLNARNCEAFEARLQAEVAKADPHRFIPAQEYDAEAALDDCTEALMDEMSLMAPFGCGNPEPLLLARGLAAEERRAVGADGSHLKLTLRQGKTVMGGIAFGMGDRASGLGDRVDAVFCLGRNTFRGVTSLQMGVKALVPASGSSPLFPDADAERGALVNGLEDALAETEGSAGAETANADWPALRGASPDGGSAPADTPALRGASPDDGSSPADTPALRGASPDDGSSPADWPALRAALAESPRGLLIVARTRETAQYALSLGELDAAARVATDPRCFPTVLAAPSLPSARGHWRQVWLADGELFAGERALWARRLPEATVRALPPSGALRQLAASLDAGDERYRALYKALRAAPVGSLREAAAAAGMDAAQARVGLRAFHQLGLIVYDASPFRYALLPPAKCVLSDSPILKAIRALAAP